MFAEYRLEAHNECPHQQHTTRAQPERTFSLCIAATFDPTQRSAARYGHGEDRQEQNQDYGKNANMCCYLLSEL